MSSQQKRKREEFLEKLRILLKDKKFEPELKEMIFGDYSVWGQYYDARFFNSAKVAVQSLTGRINPDQELRDLTAPALVEMALALEDFAQKIIKLQIELLETGLYPVEKLESLMTSMPMFQDVAEKCAEKVRTETPDGETKH